MALDCLGLDMVSGVNCNAFALGRARGSFSEASEIPSTAVATETIKKTAYFADISKP